MKALSVYGHAAIAMDLDDYLNEIIQGKLYGEARQTASTGKKV